MAQIYGKLKDRFGRCVHYHSDLDIVANKCCRCDKYYACHQCHTELESHRFGRFNVAAEKTVLCGACYKEYSYQEYATIEACDNCGSKFNPGCETHKHMQWCHKCSKYIEQ